MRAASSRRRARALDKTDRRMWRREGPLSMLQVIVVLIIDCDVRTTSRSGRGTRSKLTALSDPRRRPTHHHDHRTSIQARQSSSPRLPSTRACRPCQTRRASWWSAKRSGLGWRRSVLIGVLYPSEEECGDRGQARAAALHTKGARQMCCA